MAAVLVCILCASAPAPELESRLSEAIAAAVKAYVFIDGGSGVVVSPDGLVLTCDHVVKSRETWEVFATDGTRRVGRVLGRHVAGDLALLRLEDARGLPYLPVAEPAACRVGETVFAIGNPFLLGMQNPRLLPAAPSFAPTTRPRSPWSFSSLRSAAYEAATPWRRQRASQAATAIGMPLYAGPKTTSNRPPKAAMITSA